MIGRLRRWLSGATGEAPLFPLAVLFGLNAVDELDRTAFAVLLPEIREDFGLDLSGVLTVVALVYVAAFALQVPIAYLADRTSRVRLAIAGAAVWSLFSFATGLATTIVFLGFARAGSSIGRAVNDPTHLSLLADWYDVDVRPRVYSVHRGANAVGQFVGPLAAGFLAYAFGWRTPFLLFAIPTAILVVIALRLRDPVRGSFERRAMGASAEAILTEEEPPSFAEGWRLVWKIESLRRIWYALPFLAASLVGFTALASLLYDDVFGLDERARGFVAAITEPAQIAGLLIGARIGTRLIARDPGLVLRFVSVVAFGAGGLAVVFALAPWVGLAIAAHALISASLALLLPAILAALSLAIPPRARAMGFSVAALWVIPGLIVLPLIGAIGDTWGIRQGMLVMTPVFVLGGMVITSAGKLLGSDIRQVWGAAAARAEALFERRQGRSKLLLVRNLEVSYDGVQVLFGVDFEVDEGEVVALLGTNGAGKSTLLRAISGVVEADHGAVIFDGGDITHAPPNEIAARGVVQVPGGRGVFPTLSVAENLRVAAWLERRRPEVVQEAVERVRAAFPVLATRSEDPAADLSGGQQQMLALAMAFLSRPRLLMIDELSLGLAPVVVAQLLELVRGLQEQGTTIVLVEQSATLALSVATTAWFMEKGEIRFQGPASDLLSRPDLLRSVFLERAPAAVAPARAGTRATVVPAVDANRGPVLAARGVTRSFGGVRAVDDVWLSVQPGEIACIIGPNGAGKTTLFDVVSGYLPADAGSVVLNGADVTRDPPQLRARRGLGRSFQDARLFPALTVEEALAVALERWVTAGDPLSAALHLPTVFDAEEKVRARVDELLDFLGLDAWRTTFVRELSTGTRRIVDLACLLAHRPTVVLLDEPSSGIAQREVEALAPVLRRVRDGLDAALVVIEHDIGLASSIADRMVAMDLGRVVAEGEPAEVLGDPAVVSSYLGTSNGKGEDNATRE